MTGRTTVHGKRTPRRRRPARKSEIWRSRERGDAGGRTYTCVVRREHTERTQRLTTSTTRPEVYLPSEQHVTRRTEEADLHFAYFAFPRAGRRQEDPFRIQTSSSTILYIPQSVRLCSAFDTVPADDLPDEKPRPHSKFEISPSDERECSSCLYSGLWSARGVSRSLSQPSVAVCLRDGVRGALESRPKFETWHLVVRGARSRQASTESLKGVRTSTERRVLVPGSFVRLAAASRGGSEESTPIQGLAAAVRSSSKKLTTSSHRKRRERKLSSSSKARKKLRKDGGGGWKRRSPSASATRIAAAAAARTRVGSKIGSGRR